MPDQPHQPPPHQPLAHATGVIYEIRWNEVCPWLILVRALRVTLLIRVLILASLGVLLTQLGWATLEQQLPGDFARASSLSTEPEAAAVLSLPAFDYFAQQDPKPSPFIRGWFWITKPFVTLVSTKNLPGAAALSALLYGAWAIAVWGIFGGAIARITALYLARGETIGPIAALRDAVTVWLGTTGAPLITMLAALAMSAPLIFLGLLMRLDLVAWIAGLLWCLLLAWGLMLAIVLLGLMVGWPLMWSCLGVERSDAFDGVSRCYAYVYQRPLQFSFYILLAALLAFLGEVVVDVFATSAATLVEWTLSWGSGGSRADELFQVDVSTSTVPAATKMIDGWKRFLELLTEAYPLACLWPLSVGIYLLLRRHVDGTELDEVTLSDGTIQVGQIEKKAD